MAAVAGAGGAGPGEAGRFRDERGQTPNSKAGGAGFYGGNTRAVWGDGVGAPFDLLPNVGCPLLGFFGEDDGNPSPQDMRDMDERLTQHGKPHEFHSYPGAGHAYMDYTNENTYRERAAAASWPIALDFLAKNLGVAAAAG